MDYTPLTDQEIIQRFLHNESPRLFDELVRRHQGSVLRQCRRKVRDADDAYDVSQEVWIRVHTHLGQYQAEGPFTAWLSVIVHRRCCDHLHQNKYLLNQQLSEQLVDGLKDDEELATENFTAPTVEILQELMEHLRGEEKRLLYLKYWQGWSVNDMAQSMQTSESAIKSRLFDSRKKLQKLLDKYRKTHPVGQ